MISHEAPPATLDYDTAEWLTRRMVELDIALDKNQDYKVLHARPSKDIEGMVRVFGAAIDADITSAGMWLYLGGTWQKVS